MSGKKEIALEEKVRIVRKCLSGKSGISEGTMVAGVNHQTLLRWIGIYENYGIDGFTRKQHALLSSELCFYTSTSETSFGYSRSSSGSWSGFQTCAKKGSTLARFP